MFLKTTRAIMAQAKLHDRFWSYAMLHACDLHNMMPSTKLPGEISPHEALYGTLPDVSRVRVFGCLVWVFLPEHERRSKISPRSVPAIHLGQDPERNGYLVYIPSSNRITSSYHLTFNEKRFLHWESDSSARVPVRVPRAPMPLNSRETLYRERCRQSFHCRHGY